MKSLLKSNLYGLLFVIFGFSINSYAMDHNSSNFIKKDEEVAFTFNGDYAAGFDFLSELDEAEMKQKKQLFIEIEGLANKVNGQLAFLIAKHANIILAFPKDKPTADVTIKIIMRQDAESSNEVIPEGNDNLKTTVKSNFSAEEKLQYAQFKTEYDKWVEHVAECLSNIMFDNINIFSIHADECPISLSLKLHMYKSEAK